LGAGRHAAAAVAVVVDQRGVTAVGNFGWQELLIIFVILLLLFGATRLPALSKSLGLSIRGFKKGLQDDEPDDGEKPVAPSKDKPDS
jgi:sec-independent protein translocase protein TatA